MVLFKIVLVGLLTWQVIELIRMRRLRKKQQEQPIYIFPTVDGRPLDRATEKELERSAPPAYYAHL